RSSHRPPRDLHSFPTRRSSDLDALVLEDSDVKSFAEKGLTFEVEQQLGDGVVRCIALGSSDGLRRGMKVKGTGKPISVPVGKGRSEEHTSELQSRFDLVCRLLL